MLFQVQSTVGKFVCHIEGTGNIKVRIDDKKARTISLPGKILIHSMKNEIRKIRISNKNAKNITIGPVTEGCITEIESWGDLDIVYLDGIFSKIMDPEVSVPEYIPKSLKNLNYLLYESDISKLRGMEKWDVSHVTDMSYMFAGAPEFNQDISKWDVSSVTDMRNMFCGATSFNADVSKWNVSSVRTMWGMFAAAERFN